MFHKHLSFLFGIQRSCQLLTYFVSIQLRSCSPFLAAICCRRLLCWGEGEGDKKLKSFLNFYMQFPTQTKSTERSANKGLNSNFSTFAKGFGSRWLNSWRTLDPGPWRQLGVLTLQPFLGLMPRVPIMVLLPGILPRDAKFYSRIFKL